MAELRWILLLAGLVFLAGLTAWELRRPRQGRGGMAARDRGDRGDRHEPTLIHADEIETPTAALAAAVPPYAAAPAAAASKWNVPAWDTPTRDHDVPPLPVREARDVRVPLEDPIQVELPPPDPELESLEMESPLVMSFDEPAEPGELSEPIEGVIPTLVPREAFEITDARHYEHPIIELPPHEVPTLHAAVGRDEPSPGEPSPEECAAEHAFDGVAGVQACPDEHPDAGRMSDPAAEEIAVPAAEPVDPIVDWPPETQRHILAVRVVGVNPDRMAGRPLRQALSACGFVHGRFGIFHQPGTDGRALVSAANLSKPGVFDPVSMDFQRFRGLGLFAVLPGPLPPAAALDHLLDTAGDLAQRLHARLQDEHGMPLDEERLEAMAHVVQGMTQGLRAEPAA